MSSVFNRRGMHCLSNELTNRFSFYSINVPHSTFVHAITLSQTKHEQVVAYRHTYRFSRAKSHKCCNKRPRPPQEPGHTCEFNLL